MNVDSQLLTACQRSDRKAQAELYRKSFSLLMGVCIRYVRHQEEAVALVNMGFLKILNNLSKYQSKVPFEAWIRRIMINTVIDEYRKNKKHKATIEYTDFTETPGYEAKNVEYNEADQAFDAEDIERMIRALPPVSREVFNLFAIDGYSHKEIGELMGISIGTSKWHVSFARKTIKEMLANPIKTIQTLEL